MIASNSYQDVGLRVGVKEQSPVALEYGVPLSWLNNISFSYEDQQSSQVSLPSSVLLTPSCQAPPSAVRMPSLPGHSCEELWLWLEGNPPPGQPAQHQPGASGGGQVRSACG
jgi:hypothetical protein